ncbi:MAG: hypothetical protein KF722_17785 [Nitrospira sp.]|nr:hypothetical protein [Nitrospira sp.]
MPINNRSNVDAALGRDKKERDFVKKRTAAMTKAVTYKEYTIQPAPRQLVDSGQWELNVFISWATEDDEDSRHFVKTGRYATSEEATTQCIAYGQQIVNGQVPGCSVG